MAEQGLLKPTFDVAAVRADFPILSRQVNGKDLVYLDNGASAQKPRQVIDTLSEFYSNDYANVHRGLHTLSNIATDRYEAARETVRAFLNAKTVNEIVFTRSATEAINLVAQSYGGQAIGPDDEIIISLLEHHSNIVPWHFHRAHNGAKLKWVSIRPDGSFDLDHFKALLTDRTRMVALTHMSNVTGSVLPVKEICALAHERGVKVLIDGSQGAVHLPVDVQDLDADFYVMTGHKLYGPSGIGVLYGKEELLNAMPPYMGGGEMILDVTTDDVSYASTPHRFEAGTPPIAQAVGLGAALDYMQGLGRDHIDRHERELRDYAHQQLGQIAGLRIFGDAPDKGAIVSFELDGIHAHDISMIIDQEGIAVRAGTHCAQPLLKHYGVASTCRASFGLYNTMEEVDKLVLALIKARSFFS
jgi:cysteine desulfurase/selenocysteine lyase